MIYIPPGGMFIPFSSRTNPGGWRMAFFILFSAIRVDHATFSGGERRLRLHTFQVITLWAEYSIRRGRARLRL